MSSRNCKHRRAAAKLAACADSLSGQNLACDKRPVLYAYRLNFIVISVLCRPYGANKLPKCAISTKFSYLVDSCAHPPSPTITETKNLPLSKVSILFLYSNDFQGEIMRTNSIVCKRDAVHKRDGQTKAQLNPSSTKLGMVIEDPEHVLTPRKHFGV